MNKTIDGIVMKAVGGVFTVFTDKKYVCFAPKKLRFNEFDVLVGDKVQISVLPSGKGVVENVYPRKNKLKRPEVANIDCAFVLAAILPQPDLVLVDKILVNCFKQGIVPVVVLNKSDITDEKFIYDITQQYQSVCDVVVVSTVTGFGIDKIREYILGRTVCMAGQSAVGKTSLLNYLCPQLNKQVGSLSEKSQRGTHTTRYSQIYAACGGFIVDTTGFSLLELNDEIDSRSLMLYYDDMVQLSKNCKFHMCTHTAEPMCAVKKAANDGLFSKDRYARYLEIYKQLADFEKGRYS